MQKQWKTSHQAILGSGHESLRTMDKPERKAGGTGSSCTWRQGDPKEGRKGPQNTQPRIFYCLFSQKSLAEPHSNPHHGRFGPRPDP